MRPMRIDDERLIQAVRVAGIGIFDHDHLEGAIYWSGEMRQIYGLDASEPITLEKILSHVHPGDADRIADAVRSAHDPHGDGAFDVEHRIISRRGDTRWLLTRSRTIFAQNGDVWRPVRTIGATQDVTDRRQMFGRLRVLESVFGKHVRPTAITDTGGVIAFVNDAFVSFWRCTSHADAIGRSIFDFWKTSRGDEALARLEQEGSKTDEFVGQRSDGSTMDVTVVADAVIEPQGGLAHFIVTFRDVTERKRADAALQLKDKAIAMSLTPIAISGPEGQVLYANPAFLRLWGLADEGEALGRRLTDFAETEAVERALEASRRHGSWEGELTGKRRDGARFEMRVSMSSMRDGEGRVASYVASFLDLSERRMFETQLAQAQKMESLGQLAGGIAHDFNNSLTAILGSAELAIQELGSAHPASAYLTEIQQASQSAAMLTQQLLAFSRKQVIAPKVLDLNDVVRRLEGILRRLLPEKVSLTMKWAAAPAPVRFDPGQVEQMLMNLVVNARDALPAGGQITIEIATAWLDEEYASYHMTVVPGRHVVLSVSDDGVGMSREVRAHLFEPFFTTKAAHKGTGLGLAMVHGAMSQNGGHIDIDSEPGRGTTFKLFFPMVSDVPLAQRSAAPPIAPRGSETILLVEDDDRVRRFAEAALRGLGYSVHAFDAPEVALAALPSLAPRPVLLVTDVILPGINGRVLAERIKEQCPGVRVLFVSGYSHEIISERGVLIPGLEFLAKPYSVLSLAQRVRQALDQA